MTERADAGAGRRLGQPAALPHRDAGPRRHRAIVGAVTGIAAVLAAWIFAAAVSGGAAATSASAAAAAGSAGSVSGSPNQAGLRLEIWDADAARIAHTRHVAPGERFTLRHVHSVTRRPVKETFSVTADGVAMEELWFDTFGANLPAGPERIGDVTTTFLVEDGGYRVLHHGRLMPTVPLLAGRPHVNHELFFADGDKLRLLDLVAPSTPVELRVAAG